jgi:hypothetical protein
MPDWWSALGGFFMTRPPLLYTTVMAATVWDAVALAHIARSPLPWVFWWPWGLLVVSVASLGYRDNLEHGIPFWQWMPVGLAAFAVAFYTDITALSIWLCLVLAWWRRDLQVWPVWSASAAAVLAAVHVALQWSIGSRWWTEHAAWGFGGLILTGLGVLVVLRRAPTRLPT